MKLKFDLVQDQLVAYTHFEIDISEHVEKSPKKLKE